MFVSGLSSMLKIPGTGLLAEAPASLWLPPRQSTTGQGVDDLFYALLWISIFFFVLIVTLMVVFVILYRRRPGYEPGKSPSHNTALEMVWTAIPLAIVIYIFYEGFVAYVDMRTAPANAYEVRVVAKKWVWDFRYPNGASDNELHVPGGMPVRLLMQSQDVIHSLFIPRFRLKADLVPGRYTSTWFEAVEPEEPGQVNECDLYCAEYCGTDHSRMVTKVKIHRRDEFDKWLAEAANLLGRYTPVEAGAILYEKKGCNTCHSIDGSSGKGPSFKGIWGQTHTFANASPTAVDENYVRESILEPLAKIRESYQGIMPTYKGTMKDDEIGAMIEYIKTLK